MSFDKKEFIESFLEESTERLNSISSDIEKLIKSPEDKDLHNSILRNLHTIKGSARMLDFNNIEEIQKQDIENTIFVGELSLDGKINKINGVLPICIEARRLGIEKVIVPFENSNEAAIVEGIDVIGVKTLTEVVEYLNGVINIEPNKVDVKKYFEQNNKYIIDFSEVKGQENIKRALEVSAAGGHNCLLIRKSGFSEKL